jgi:hypothetical protein
MFDKTPNTWLPGITVENNNLVIPLSVIPELQSSEVVGSNADIRKVMFALVDMLYNRWNSTLQADRPVRMSITRSTQFNDLSGATTRNYTQQFQVSPLGIEVVNEPTV